MKAYADASFIVALYLQQENSSAATAFIERSGEPLPFTTWHRVEVRNAVRLSLFRNVIDLPHCNAQLKQIEEDLRGQTLLAHVPLDWVAVFREVENLGEAYTGTIGCRSGDLVHVASAVSLGFGQFLSFDERQKKLAKEAGLSVKF